MDESTCKHCGKRIVLDPVFGWIHGELGGGWNTSCEDDKHRAKPKKNWDVVELSETQKLEVSEEAINKLADELQDEAKFTSWDYVHYDRESALDIVKRMIKAGWRPNE